MNLGNCRKIEVNQDQTSATNESLLRILIGDDSTPDRREKGDLF